MKLHHVGFIVDDIDKNIHFFKHKKIVNRIIDKTQNAELICLDDVSFEVYHLTLNP